MILDDFSSARSNVHKNQIYIGCESDLCDWLFSEGITGQLIAHAHGKTQLTLIDGKRFVINLNG